MDLGQRLGFNRPLREHEIRIYQYLLPLSPPGKSPKKYQIVKGPPTNPPPRKRNRRTRPAIPTWEKEAKGIYNYPYDGTF